MRKFLILLAVSALFTACAEPEAGSNGSQSSTGVDLSVNEEDSDDGSVIDIGAPEPIKNALGQIRYYAPVFYPDINDKQCTDIKADLNQQCITLGHKSFASCEHPPGGTYFYCAD